jgi:tetratricopeptide (TPR) repeat protein
MDISDRLKRLIKKNLPYLIFLSAMLIYIMTLCPAVYWRDSAEFVDVAFSLGIPHPAGFPSYMPLANLMTYLPLGSIPFKVNLFSAIMGALASVVLFFLTKELIITLRGKGDDWNLYFSAATAMAFAFSYSLWESSVAAEVYAGMGAAAGGILFFAIKWKSSGDKRYLFAGTFLYGLSAGIHATVAFFLPALLIFVLINFKDRLKLSDFILSIFFFIFGFSAFIYLPIRSLANPMMDWGNPETLEQFLILVTDRKDTAYHFAVSRGELPGKILIFLKIMIKELTILWPVASLFGLYLTVKREWRTSILLILFFLGHISFFIWYWNGGTVYIPSFMVVMALGGAGLYFIGEYVRGVKRIKTNFRRILLVAALAFAAFSFLTNFRSLDKSNYYAAHNIAFADYIRFEYDSLALTSIYWPTFFYFQDIEKLREDVTVVPISDILEPKYFNRVTAERFPRIDVPSIAYESDTAVAYLSKLIKLNIDERKIYIGPEVRIVEKISKYVIPEIFFYRLLTDKDIKVADGEFYQKYFFEYLERLVLFFKQELSSRGGEFMGDNIYKDYYAISLRTLSVYFVERRMWSVNKTVLILAEPVVGFNPDLKDKLAYSLMQIGEYEQADKIFREIIKNYPNVVWPKLNHGFNLIQLERYDDAMKEFTKAVEMGGVDTEAYYGIGLVLYKQGKFLESKEMLTKAKKLVTGKTNTKDVEDIDKLLEIVTKKLSDSNSDK